MKHFTPWLLYVILPVLFLVLAFLSSCKPEPVPCETICECGYTLNDNCECDFTAECDSGLTWDYLTCSCVSFPSFTADITNNFKTETVHFAALDETEVLVDFIGDTIYISAFDEGDYVYLMVVDTSGADITTGTYVLNDIDMYGYVHIEDLSPNDLYMYGIDGTVEVTAIDQAQHSISAVLNFPVGDFGSSTYCVLSNGMLEYWE